MAKRIDKFEQRLGLLAKRLHLIIHGRELSSEDFNHWVKVLKSLRHDVKTQDELCAVISWFCSNPSRSIRNLESFDFSFLEIVNQYRDSLRYDVPSYCRQYARSVLVDFPEIPDREGCAIFYDVCKWFDLVGEAFKVPNCPIERGLWTDVFLMDIEEFNQSFLCKDALRFAASYITWIHNQVFWRNHPVINYDSFFTNGNKFLLFLDLIKRVYCSLALTNDERLYFRSIHT